MVTGTKITLSPQELQLVTNTEWILTKRVIIDKVYGLLGGLSEKMKPMLQAGSGWLPEPVIASEPKIYRGENYLQLPYVLLDYPRCFSGNDAFAIRTLFWWGNFFSITLHLSGNYKKMFAEIISTKLAALQKDNYYICINEDQWQHHYENDNYIEATAINALQFEQLIAGKSFIKLSRRFSLHQWEEMPELIGRSFVEMLEMLKT